MKNQVDPKEAQAELITGALLVVVIALLMLGDVGNGFAMLAAGLVLLGSGVYQTQRGWHVSLITWLLVVTLTLGGLGVRLYLVSYMRINFVAITLIAIGAYMFYSVFRPR